MKKILVLTTTYPRWFGDTEPAFVHNLCVQLASDFEVHVLAPHTQGALAYEIMDGVVVHRFAYLPQRLQCLCYDGGIVPKLKAEPGLIWQVPFLFLAMLWQGCRLARKERVSLIHAHWIIPQGLIGLLICRFVPGKVRLMVTSHGADLFALKHPFLQALKAWVLSRADSVTVVSEVMRQFCVEKLGVKRPIEVASMGVDCRHRFFPFDDGGQRDGLVFVGRLVEKKGVRFLIEAFHKFLQVYPGERLVIVGEGTEKAALEDQVRQLGMETQVSFMGSVDADQVASYFNKARIAVMPSIVAQGGDQEGLGLVAAEALACGCITLVADIPAVQGVHNDPDLQFASGDSDSLLRCLCYVYENPDEALAKARSLREHVVANYDWLGVGNNYKRLISLSLSGS